MDDKNNVFKSIVLKSSITVNDIHKKMGIEWDRAKYTGKMNINVIVVFLQFFNWIIKLLTIDSIEFILNKQDEMT